MPRIYEVPTHLNVEDTLIGNLTARQLVRLAAFAALAYGAWDQAVFLPPAPRAVLAGLLVAIGLASALLQPGGRGLDEWVFAALRYFLSPRRLVWQRPEPEASDWRQTESTDWADLHPRLGWGQADDGADDEEEQGASRVGGRRL